MRNLMMIFSLSFVLVAQQLSGQERNVKGRVTDQADGSTLPGVSIRVLGTGQGTISDTDGNYSLQVSQSADSLMFSFIGMKTLIKKIPASLQLDVQMESAQVGLDEVVVIGYGTVKKSDLTGSVSSIGSDVLDEIPANSFDQEIQGRISGVQVTQLSSQPGGATSIKIRGGNSIMAGTEPLYVIDGVIMEGDKNFSFIGSPAENGLSSINPSDIASIDILKDASATAIYGARGANGVVIITTKRGKAGKDKITFEAYTGTQVKAKSIDVMNASQFASLYDEAGLNANPNYTPKYPNPDSLGKGTDWQSEIYRDAPISNYQLSLSGGNEKTTYLLSAGYFTQDGIIHGSDFKRYSFRANLDREINDRLKIGTSIMYSRTKSNTVPTDTPGGFFPGVVNTALIFSPVIPVYNEEGQYTLTDPNADAWLDNPVAVTREVEAVNRVSRLVGNVFLKYNVMDGLDFKSSFGLDSYHNLQDMYTPRYVYSGSWNDGQARFVTADINTYLFENTLTWDRKFGEDHKLNVLGGLTFQKDDNRSFIDIVTGFPNDILGYYGIENATNLPTVYASFTESATVSYLGRINYNLKEKYLLTLTGRVDGSSRFGKNKRFGFFPAAAMAWRASEESFIENLNVFSNLKFRISYGLSGNDRIPLYAYISTLGSTLYYFNNAYPGSGFAPSIPGNNDLGWETTRQFDLGLDMGFYKGRISLTADYYVKTTVDMLYNFNLPWTSGYNSFIKNIGSMRNSGLEMALNTTNFVGDFKWNTAFNFSINTNEILDLNGRDLYINNDEYKLKIGDWSVIKEGEEMGSFYGLLSDGIWQLDEAEEAAIYGAEPGDFKYVDLNNDGIINDADKKIIGHALPDFTWGLSNDFSFKNFSLNIFIQGVHGNEILNSNRFELESGNGLSNASVDMLNRWTPDNPSDTYPRANRDADYLRMSDRYLEDGSYIRLKSLTLGYNLPQKALNFLKVQSARVYFTGTNLFTITDYTGFDPEVGHFGKDNTRMGYDYGSYPSVKTYTFGIILNI